MEKYFKRKGVDITLFIHRPKFKLVMTQIHVVDIVFRATSSELAFRFVEQMRTEFEMSMVGELTFFLGLKIRQLKYDIFFHSLNMLKN